MQWCKPLKKHLSYTLQFFVHFMWQHFDPISRLHMAQFHRATWCSRTLADKRMKNVLVKPVTIKAASVFIFGRIMGIMNWINKGASYYFLMVVMQNYIVWKDGKLKAKLKGIAGFWKPNLHLVDLKENLNGGGEENPVILLVALASNYFLSLHLLMTKTKCCFSLPFVC